MPYALYLSLQGKHFVGYAIDLIFRYILVIERTMSRFVIRNPLIVLLY